MPFHRLAVPSYFGGLPSGYDYINNALSGTPAFADSAKVGGPNEGTYFVGFGDDATSQNTNRPNKALAQNTDYLDDLLHRDLAVQVRSAVASSGGATVSSVTLLGPGVWLGQSASAVTLSDLFHITDASDNDLIDGAGNQVLVTAITGGSLGGGFSSGNIVLTLSPAIAAGTSYRVYYGMRSNLASLPADAFVSMRIRSAMEIDAGTESLFAALHGHGEAYNAAWDSTIWDLTARGLDGSYRRATTGAAGAFNSAGSGATITRDGRAPTSTTNLTVRGQPDPYNAFWVAREGDIGAGQYTSPMGSIGFAALVHRLGVQGEGGSASATKYTPSLAAFASFWLREQDPATGSPTTGAGYATRVVPKQTGKVTDMGLAVPTYLLSLDDPSSYFYCNSGGLQETAVALGYDLMQFTIAGHDVTVRITNIDTTDSSRRTVYVAALDGGALPYFVPSLGTDNVAVSNVTWVSTRFLVGEGGGAIKRKFAPTVYGGSPWENFFLVPALSGLASNVADTTGNWTHYLATQPTAYVGALPPSAPAYADGVAFAWGTFQKDMTKPNPGTWLQSGKLLGDGSVAATRVVTAGAADSAFNIDATIKPDAVSFRSYAKYAMTRVCVPDEYIDALVSATNLIDVASIGRDTFVLKNLGGSDKSVGIHLPNYRMNGVAEYPFVRPGQKFTFLFLSIGAALSISDWQWTETSGGVTYQVITRFASPGDALAEAGTLVGTCCEITCVYNGIRSSGGYQTTYVCTKRTVFNFFADDVH